MDTPATSDVDEVKLAIEEVSQEVRVTRNRKRVMNAGKENESEERAHKRQAVANRAYVAINLQIPGHKVRDRVNCEEEYQLMNSKLIGCRDQQG
jgi:hypothetical protein